VSSIFSKREKKVKEVNPDTLGDASRKRDPPWALASRLARLGEKKGEGPERPNLCGGEGGGRDARTTERYYPLFAKEEKEKKAPFFLQ